MHGKNNTVRELCWHRHSYIHLHSIARLHRWCRCYWNHTDNQSVFSCVFVSNLLDKRHYSGGSCGNLRRQHIQKNSNLLQYMGYSSDNHQCYRRRRCRRRWCIFLRRRRFPVQSQDLPREARLGLDPGRGLHMGRGRLRLFRLGLGNLGYQDTRHALYNPNKNPIWFDQVCNCNTVDSRRTRILESSHRSCKRGRIYAQPLSQVPVI